MKLQACFSLKRKLASIGVTGSLYLGEKKDGDVHFIVCAQKLPKLAPEISQYLTSYVPEKDIGPVRVDLVVNAPCIADYDWLYDPEANHWFAGDEKSLSKTKKDYDELANRQAFRQSRYRVTGGRSVGWGIDSTGYGSFYCDTWDDCHDKAAVRKFPLYKIEELDGNLYRDHYNGFHRWKKHRKTASSYIADISLSSLPKTTQRDISYFFTLQADEQLIYTLCMLQELISKTDAHNFHAAREHIKQTISRLDPVAKKKKQDELFKNEEKYVFLLNDKVIDGNHHIAWCEYFNYPRAIKVLDLTPLRFQQKAPAPEPISEKHTAVNGFVKRASIRTGQGSSANVIQERYPEMVPNEVKADEVASSEKTNFESPYEKIKIELGEVSFDSLKAFLDEYYPYHFFLTEEGSSVFITIPKEGATSLTTLLQHYWQIDTHRPDKFFKVYAEQKLELISKRTPVKLVNRRAYAKNYSGACSQIQKSHTRRLVRGAAGSYWATGTGANLVSRLRADGARGEMGLAFGDRVRFRNPETYGHGTLEYFPDSPKPYTVTWAKKGSIAPSGAQLFDSLDEVASWLDQGGYNEWFINRANYLPKLAKPEKKDTVPYWQQDRPSLVMEEHGLDKTQDISVAVAFNKKLHEVEAILRKYGFAIWSPDGSLFLRGVIYIPTGKVYEYGTPEYNNTLYGDVRVAADAIIPYAQWYHDNYYHTAREKDIAGVSYMPLQQPKPPEKLEGYKFFMLRDTQDPRSHSQDWTKTEGFNGHAQTAILQDAQGNKYVAVYEAQATYGDPTAGMTYKEIYRRLAQSIKQYAASLGLPVALATSGTASAVYGREPGSRTFTRAYSKGGYIRQAFNDVFGEPAGRIELEELWMPMQKTKKNFVGVLYPGTRKATLRLSSRIFPAVIRLGSFCHNALSSRQASDGLWVSGWLVGGKIIVASDMKERHIDVLLHNYPLFKAFYPDLAAPEKLSENVFQTKKILAQHGIYWFMVTKDFVVFSPETPEVDREEVTSLYQLPAYKEDRVHVATSSTWLPGFVLPDNSIILAR